LLLRRPGGDRGLSRRGSFGAIFGCPTSVTARLTGVNPLSNGRTLPNGQEGDIRRGGGGA